MTDAPKLKPCPFCGGNAYMAKDICPDGYGVFRYVECRDCRSKSGSKYHSYGNDCPMFYVEVRDAWNTRAVRIAEAIEAAEQRGYARGIEAAVVLCDKLRQTLSIEQAEAFQGGRDNDGYRLHTAQCAMLDAMEAIRALSPTPPATAAIPETPTSAQLYSVCLSLRHDYGLMDREDQEELKLQARECWKAISRALSEQKAQ